MDAERKYAEEPRFRDFVDYLAGAVRRQSFTADELMAAALLAVGGPVAMTADLLRPGDAVFVDGRGPARVVGVRQWPSSHCMVRMDDGSQPPFWADDAELLLRLAEPRMETIAHIGEVRKLLGRAVAELRRRARVHDASQLEPPESAIFEEFTPQLRGTEYGSDEYRRLLAAMGPALKHHYAHNRHHPEHHADGVRGMDLLDIVEMLCDWRAAALRHAGGDIRRSVELNQGRFGYSDELKRILINTLPYLEG